jgi:hypothetical protein
MGQYHSRFVDLPLPLASDLVQLWDRPPTNQSKSGRSWLSLARATLALRSNAHDEAEVHFRTAAAITDGQPLAQTELALGLAVLESRGRPAEIPGELGPVPALLDALNGPDADCLPARYVGQVSHALNRAGQVARSLELHRALPDGPETHPFARSRRANGIAYALHRRGDQAGALTHARLAATFAGDAGHVRLRAMALLMISRIGRSSTEAVDARQRARGIALALFDVRLLSRCDAADRDTRPD